MSIKNKPRSRRSNLAFTISAALAATALCGTDQVLAQDDSGALEEVIVTGIRGSLQQSMDIKRDSAGVVDAISAEDIGKFPDTNLAESLQRITGVSIDRVNGEGSQVTVRGFGPAFNMVTLNGRTMPAGGAYGGGSGAGGAINTGGGTRAFDFANLASESISGVEVYKTGKANISSGGIGATMNIKTARPLDNPGLQASVGFKAMNDTTVSDNGDEWTPEVSGLLSWTDDAETFGVALTFSYQERDSASANAAANDWNIRYWDASDTVDASDRSSNGYSLYPGLTAEQAFTNVPDNGQLFARPNDFRWAYSEYERTRTNYQLTGQFAPTDAVTLTLDYTFAENELWEHRGEWTMWFNNNSTITNVTFDDNAIATPISISEDTSNKDVGYEQQLREQTNTMESVGFNMAWDVTDTLTLNFDLHDSSLESLPSGPGKSGEISISTGAPVIDSWTVTFPGDLPYGNFVTNGNQPLAESDIGSAQGRIWYASQTMDITQFKLDGVVDLDSSHFDFGVANTSTEMVQQTSVRQQNLGGWNVSNPGEFAPGSFRMFNMAAEFEDYDMSGAYPVAARAVDVADLCNQTVDLYQADQPDWACEYDPNFANDRKIEEDVTAAYFQLGFASEIGDYPVNVLTGLRYEKTDLTSGAFIRTPLYRVWQDNNDFQVTIYDDASDAINGKLHDVVEHDYSNVLPSFDFDIGFSEDLKGRFSFSKTIARADYGNLYTGTSNFGQINPTYFVGAVPTATRANPRLMPLESDNYDISLEWYFGDASYASAGVFEKRVKNFIGTGQADETHYDMRDASDGQRIREAEALLIANNIAIDATSLFAMTVIVDNPGPSTVIDPTTVDPNVPGSGTVYFPGGITLADFVVNGGVIDSDFANDVAAAYDIHADETDNIAVWRTSFPENNKEAKLNGFEFAVQHFFGDTGLGVQANYTVVNGDIGYDNLADPSESQFALLGLSDSANLALIYENFGFSARLAYNWRDEFLRQVNQGNSRNPVYVDEYEQWDLNVSYNITEDFSVLFEGINLTEENTRWVGRNDRMVWYLEDLGARYNIGARYKF